LERGELADFGRKRGELVIAQIKPLERGELTNFSGQGTKPVGIQGEPFQGGKRALTQLWG
jgi:hypothetical protein